MKIVSACLIGVNCAYNGNNKYCEKVVKIIGLEGMVLICPEQLGGLPTPRNPAEQKGERVFTRQGNDVTKYFEKGAQEILKLAQRYGCKEAILKSRSPSCGSNFVYDGTFSHILIKGDGVLARLLKQNDIKVLTEEEI